MSRYFVAVEPPREQSVRIVAVMRSLGDQWPVPHITVKSPNGLTPDLEWLPVVRETVRHSVPFEVKIGRPSTFDSRVLYLSVDGFGLGVLHDAILKNLSSLNGFVSEFSIERQFTPHVTLTVARRGQTLPAFERWASALGNFEPFEVTHLTVFVRDNLATPYRVLTQLDLANGPARPSSNQGVST